MEKRRKKSRRRLSMIVLSCLLTAFCGPTFMAHSAVEEHSDQRVMTLDQLNSNGNELVPKKSDYLSVAFLLISCGAMGIGSSGHWFQNRRQTLKRREAEKIQSLNDETSALKTYLDGARAIRDSGFDFVFNDIEPQLDRLIQDHERALREIDSHTAVLKADVAKATGNIIRRYCI